MLPPRTVNNDIPSLQAKLERGADKPRHLLTVHGVGYKWADISVKNILREGDK